MSPSLRRVMRNQGIVTAEAIGSLTQPRTQNYSLQVLLDAPGAYWRLDDLVDASTHGNTLTVTGSVPTTTGLIVNEPSLGRSYSGSAANFLSAADSATLDVGDVFSLEAWIKIATDPSVGDFRCIVSKDTNSFWFGIHRLSTGIELVGVKYGVSSFVASSVLLTVGISYHVVVTKSGDAIKLWVNGVDRTGTLTTGVVLANNASIVQIGRSANAGATPANEPWDGVIDDVSIYPTVLSQARVIAHFTGGGGGATPQSYQNEILTDLPRAFWTWS